MKKLFRNSIVGIDEVGRGPFAGPLVVCACALHKALPKRITTLINDSKQLSETEREKCVALIQPLINAGGISFALTRVSPRVIDTIGIGRATKRAVASSLKKLKLNPTQCDVRLDGLLKAPSIYTKQRTIVKGDMQEKSIGLASIIAKVHRDTYMKRQRRTYPEYGFERHKGYGTAAHRAAIKRYGMCPLHRRSFIKFL